MGWFSKTYNAKTLFDAIEAGDATLVEECLDKVTDNEINDYERDFVMITNDRPAPERSCRNVGIIGLALLMVPTHVKVPGSQDILNMVMRHSTKTGINKLFYFSTNLCKSA